MTWAVFVFIVVDLVESIMGEKLFYTSCKWLMAFFMRIAKMSLM